MLLAEGACVWRRESRPHVRAWAYLVSALANNLPDIDVAYTWLDGPKPLGSLLNHRGHTHTLALALPAAWLLGWAAWRWLRKRHPGVAAPERQLLVGLLLLGPVVHLLLDFGNNYGVHPFWPLSGRWFYGDSIFIVEPLWLALAVPVLARTLARRWLRIVLGVVLCAVLVMYWFLPFFNATARLVLVATVAASFVVARRASERARITFALAGWLAVALVFVLASQRAKARLRDAAQAAFPALSVHDISAAPLPGDPTCWEGLVAGEQGGTYRVLRATVALPPARVCAVGADSEPTAPVARLDRPAREGVHWLTEYHADVSELSRLRREDCRFRALLRFARLPYVAASARVAGDLRYDRKPELDFSDVPLPASPSAGACPRFIPGWSEPRELLFQP
jgi:inner membrane protein